MLKYHVFSEKLWVKFVPNPNGSKMTYICFYFLIPELFTNCKFCKVIFQQYLFVLIETYLKINGPTELLSYLIKYLNNWNNLLS